MWNNSLKKEKGITLIALVITIIVMLILVTVIINIAVNGGLFDYAGSAASETETKKKEEQNWIDLDENLSNDQLIAKYTGVNPDLAKLRKYYIDRDETAIPNAREEIEQIIENGSIDIIKYNNAVYKIISNYDENTDTFNFMVDEIIGEEAAILTNGTELVSIKDICFYKYENIIYKMIFTGTSINASTLNNEVVVVNTKRGYGAPIEGYIQFTPKENQTWAQWLEDSDYDKIDLQLLSDYTFKQLLGEGNTRYDFPSGRPRISVSNVLKLNGEECSTNSIIVSNSVYVFGE